MTGLLLAVKNPVFDLNKLDCRSDKSLTSPLILGVSYGLGKHVQAVPLENITKLLKVSFKGLCQKSKLIMFPDPLCI